MSHVKRGHNSRGIVLTAHVLLLVGITNAQVMPAGVTIQKSKAFNRATFVSAGAGITLQVAAPAGRQADVSDFVKQYGALFGVTDPAKQLSPASTRVDGLGYQHTSYDQVQKGVHVFAGVLRVHQNAAGAFTAANGHVFPIDDKLDVKPTYPEKRAQQTAQNLMNLGLLGIEHSELVLVDPGWYGDAPRGPHLAWYIIVSRPLDGIREGFFIDAHSGEILDHWNMIHGSRVREIHDAGGTSTLPGPVSRTEGQAPVANADVNRAYDYAGDTYDYYFRAFGRDSLNNAGLTMIVTANSTAPTCPNAFWNGSQMVFCTGTITDDIMGHELTHGVTQFTANLIYQNQSGQLNESFSDVFGELIDLFNGNASSPGAPGGSPLWPTTSTGPGADTPNNLRTACSPNPGHADGVRWLCGEDAAAFGGAIRDMWNPTCFNDPDRANSSLETCNPLDNGGVHSGSGVANHAFAIVTDGKTFNGQTVTGIGAIKSAAVWYRALTVYLTPSSDFSDAATAFNQAATDLIGTTPNDPRSGGPSASVFTADDAQQVNKAILATEMNTDGACGGNPPPGMNLATPNGGESLGRGRANRILWNAFGAGSTVTITLLQGGVVNSTIVSGAANNNSYTWNTPSGLALASNYRVRITDGTYTDESEADFSIINYNDDCTSAICLTDGLTFMGQTTGATGIQATSCGGGNDTKDVWHVYQPAVSGTFTINTFGSMFDTTLAVYNACGGTELACNDDFNDTTSQVTLSMTAGNQYLIRVAGWSGRVGPYKLTVVGGQGTTCTPPPPGVTVTSPNGGEVWARGVTRAVTWNSVSGGATVTIDLLQGGSPVLNIATGAPNNGSFSWLIPAAQTTGTNYRVRVNDGVNIDTSNADFSIADTVDYFTELFTGSTDSFDLANKSILFTPGGTSGYTACVSTISSFPTDPTGGTALFLSDDSFVTVNLASGAAVKLYGTGYGSFYVGSNGYVTFLSGDSSLTVSFSNHFTLKRIAALLDDLDPGAGGSVSWRQLADRAVVTWLNVPEFGVTNLNTFQIEMFFDGRIRISWLTITAVHGLAGLSNGGGQPAGFVESNLSSYFAGCTSIPADFDQDGDVDMSDFAKLQACLSGALPQTNPACDNMHLNHQVFIGLADVAVFLQCLSGADVPGNPACAN